MHFANEYVIQWERVKTLEDVIAILRAINPSFDDGDHLTVALLALCKRQPKQCVTVMD